MIKKAFGVAAAALFGAFIVYQAKAHTSGIWDKD